VAGWSRALELAGDWGASLTLERLLEEAVYYAEHGYPVSVGQAAYLAEKVEELRQQPGFSAHFLNNGQVPAPHSRHPQPALARTLRRLIMEGLDSFYRGNLAQDIAAELSALGAPLTLDDLAVQHALLATPLEIPVRGARIYNTPPPTQGVASLLILGIYDALSSLSEQSGKKVSQGKCDGFALVHDLVECTKQAFLLRDAHVADPEHVRQDMLELLNPDILRKLAEAVNRQQAAPWQTGPTGGDTVWFGVIDNAGRAVSCIQSIYFEFGSGVVLPETGLTWHNRGLGFSLDSAHPNYIGPRKKPFHTLNPALALFADGRVMPYGCMGGEGQPQSQAAIFARYAWLRYDLQSAITAPRWVLGRTWGDSDASLKIEENFPAEIITALEAAGHVVTRVKPFNDLMGHAGALVRHTNGLIEGASDPRCDGLVAAY
jgi:gamma-glutamyltranspeptidase/glutathione hydrolase